MRGHDQAAYDRFSDATELPLLVLALLFLPVLLAPFVFTLPDAVAAGLDLLSWTIWAAFAAEYVIKLYLAPDRGRMVRTHVFDLVIVVVPFLRPLRGLRLLRLVHASAAVGRAGVGGRRLLGRRGFSGFLLVVFGTVTAAGLLAWVFERGHPEAQITHPVEGIWWALVTATTVGYGDMVPQSAEGRGVAVLLMLLGIALFAVVTANIAAFFVEESDDHARDAELRASLAALDERLDRIEQHLLAQGGDTAATGAPAQRRR